MKITLHSPLDCPGCGSRFEGAWVPGKETSSQACPSCGELFTATWKGWTFIPATQGGSTVAGWVNVPIEFQLK